MKINEKFIDGDGSTFHVKKTFDPNPTLKSVQQARELTQHDPRSEYRHVARIPGWLVGEWCKEAGIRWDDVHARNEVVKKKLLSGEYNDFRNWTGTY